MDPVDFWSIGQWPIRKMDAFEDNRDWQLFKLRLDEAYPPTTLEYAAQRDEHVESIRSYAKIMLKNYRAWKCKKKKKNKKKSLAFFIQRMPFSSAGQEIELEIAANKHQPVSHELILAVKFLTGESIFPVGVVNELDHHGLLHLMEPKVFPPAEPEAATDDSVDTTEAWDFHGKYPNPAPIDVALLTALPTGTPSEMSASDAFATPDTPTSTELGTATPSSATLSRAVDDALEALAKAVKDHMVNEIRALEAEKEQLQAELAAIKAKHEVDRNTMESLHRTMQAWVSQMKGGD